MEYDALDLDDILRGLTFGPGDIVHEFEGAGPMATIQALDAGGVAAPAVAAPVVEPATTSHASAPGHLAAAAPIEVGSPPLLLLDALAVNPVDSTPLGAMLSGPVTNASSTSISPALPLNMSPTWEDATEKPHLF